MPTIASLRTTTSIDPLDAELILANILRTSREFVVAHPEKRLNFRQAWRYKRQAAERAAGKPLAYITGRAWFYGLEFLVNRHTLIPRPDTELLVEAGAQQINRLHQAGTPVTLIDVGTGSGCVAIAIMKTLVEWGMEDLVTAFAGDTSKSALRVARRNAKRYHVDITFKHGHLLEPFMQILKQKKYCIITANLPYLDAAWHAQEPSIQFEPKTALVAGKSGTALYEELFQYVKTSAVEWDMYLEIDPRHADEMKVLLERELPGAQFEIKDDLQGLPRMIQVKSKDNVTLNNTKV